MTPRKPLTELEADEFVCVRCGAVAQEHPLDGMGECPACAEHVIMTPHPKRRGSPRNERGQAWRAALTHCPAGHPYEGDNLYMSPAGFRGCRQCRHDQNVRSKAKKAGAAPEPQ